MYTALVPGGRRFAVNPRPVRPRPRSPSEMRVVHRAEGPKGALHMAVKLFVGGLSFSTSSDRLREAFAASGAVESATVVTDRDTGRSRGFGFVEMATPEEAEQAINRLNGTNLDGRTIQVEKAKAPASGGGGDRRGGGGGGRGGFGGGGGAGRGGSRGGRW